MRCGVVHNGRFGDLQHTVKRVIFALPGQPTVIDGKFGDAYIYSVTKFCANFTKCVEIWFENNNSNSILIANLPRLMQYRIGGFPPYIGGMTVLA